MTHFRTIAVFALPLVIALAGAAWVVGATRHYEHATGRGFYQLAGYHYTVPEDGFRYHPGGQQIERWTVIIPPNAIAALLLASFVRSAIALRRQGLRFLLRLGATYGLAYSGLVLFVAWYSVNIMGVFI